MKKFKKLFVAVLSSVFMLGILPLNVSAAQIKNTSNVDNPGISFKNVLPSGKIENIYIDENREVFVNGKNITTITPIGDKTPIINKTSITTSSTSTWTYAGQTEYKYDLSGVSVSGAAAICKGLGLTTVTISTIKSVGGSYIVNSMFSSGVYIKDLRSIYYKNINQSRPDMKEVHKVYFTVEASNLGKYEKYLGSCTTYGGV